MPTGYGWALRPSIVPMVAATLFLEGVVARPLWAAEIPRDSIRVVKPEERGESFADKTPHELILLLNSSHDPIELRKAAKIIGDLSLKGEEKKIQDADRETLENYIDKTVIPQTADKKADVRTEANAQIQRLWRTATPVLLKHVENANLTIAEASAKNLVLMRNREIVKSLVAGAQGAQGQKQLIYIMCLGMLTQERRSDVSDRTCMDTKTSQSLADEFVRPFLRQLRDKTKDKETLAFIEKAMKDLDAAAKAGVWVQDPPTTQKSPSTQKTAPAT